MIGMYISKYLYYRIRNIPESITMDPSQISVILRTIDIARGTTIGLGETGVGGSKTIV